MGSKIVKKQGTQGHSAVLHIDEWEGEAVNGG